MRYHAGLLRTQPAAAPRQCPVQWSWLYALCPLLVGLLLVVRRQPLTRTGHLVIECGVVLLVYGLMALWTQANCIALATHNPAAKHQLVYRINRPRLHDLTGGQDVSMHSGATVPTLGLLIPHVDSPVYPSGALQERRN